VVATPGRLMDHYKHHNIDLDHVTQVVLDEADAPQRPDMGERVGGAGDPTKIGNYGHICLLRDIAQAVRDGRSPAIPPQEAALAVRVICSIYESTRTGRPIVF